MEIDEWWPKLDAPTQDWLISHNGESLPQTILVRIAKAGGAHHLRCVVGGTSGAKRVLRI